MSASRLVSALCCVAALVCGTAVAQTPRVVKVGVSIESPQFTDFMSAEQRKKIESTVAGAVATELAKLYPIVDWRADAGNAIPVATLTAAVVETLADTPDPQIDLVWRAKAGNTALSLAHIGTVELYSSFTSDRPVADSTQFSVDLTKVAVNWVMAETRWESFKSLFLSNVLIANKVIAKDAPLVVLPLSYKDVRMAKNSILLVRYQGSGPNGPQQKEVTLTDIAPHLSNPQVVNTETHVNDCGAGSAGDSPQRKWTTCAAPLNANPERTVSVYAADYKYQANPDVEGGLVVEE